MRKSLELDGFHLWLWKQKKIVAEVDKWRDSLLGVDLYEPVLYEYRPRLNWGPPFIDKKRLWHGYRFTDPGPEEWKVIEMQLRQKAISYTREHPKKKFVLRCEFKYT